jgi:2',3'-cyclic-nucleotide 2'-phosphodiesterase/3'-nucleotidase
MFNCRDITRDLGPLSQDTSVLHLRILATSDLHAKLMPFDYFADRPDARIGLLQIAGLVSALREGVPNCLLFDNGDTFQGSALDDLETRSTARSAAPHAMIEVMTAMGYDAATLGNHDFDYGIEMLEDVLADAGFPFVLANAQHPGNGEPFRPRHVMLERKVEDVDGTSHTLRIGVTGTVPPQVARWNSAVLKDALVFGDPVAAVDAEARALRAAGADIVVALAHSGLGDIALPTPDQADTPRDTFPENAALAIAALPDVDIVIAGHTHDVYPPSRDCDIEPPGTPIVQPGFWGSHLGCIDIALTKPRGAEAGPWSILKSRVEAFPSNAAHKTEAVAALNGFLRDKPALRRSIATKHRAARAMSQRRIGRTEVPLHTYFSGIAPCAATQLISDAQRAAARALLPDTDDVNRLPLLSAVAPMRSGGLAGPDQFTDVPAGELLLRHVSDLYFYPNMLAVLRLTGRDLTHWLERAASIFNRIDAGSASDQVLLDREFAGYNFDRLDGLTYEIDVSLPARTDARGERCFETSGRIAEIRFADGRPVDPDEHVLVVTNSYRAAGGGNFPVCAEADRVAIRSVPVRDCIIDFVRSGKSPIHPVPTPCFTLRGLGAATAIFETGPGALRHLGEVADLGLAPRGTTDDGFLRFEMQDPSRSS